MTGTAITTTSAEPGADRYRAAERSLWSHYGLEPLQAAAGFWKRALGLCLALCACFAFPTAAAAVTYPVSNTNDAGPGSLRQAIMDANDTPGVADLIRVDVTGTVNLGTPLDTLLGELEIRGPGADQFTVRRGMTAVGNFRVFKVQSGAEVEISGLTVTNGRVTPASPPPNSGGGIENEGTLALRGVVVSDNEVSQFAQAFGGGIANASSGELTIERSIVSDNEASGESSTGSVAAAGGGISSTGALVLRDSSVSGNSATATAVGQPVLGGGGGIAGGGPVTIERSTLSGNNAGATGNNPQIFGGGIHASGPALTIQRSTVSDNRLAPVAGSGAPAVAGGGIRDLTTATILRSVTLAGNQAALDGAANLAGAATLQNTIVADPEGGPNCEVAQDSDGHNLEDANSCGLTGATDLTSTDPELGPLKDNGGPTMTHALGADGPAIDRGNSSGLSTDQRGEPRPSDFPDIPNAPGGDGADVGAFEVQAPPPPPPPPPTAPPDTSITLALDADKKQKVKRLRVTVGCGDEACEAELGGRAVAKQEGGKRNRASAAKTKRKKTFKVKPRTLSIAAGEQKTERVRFKKNRQSVRMLRRLLKRGACRKGTMARLKVTATDAAGNTATERVKVKLKR
jgi:hypothetical protein